MEVKVKVFRDRRYSADFIAVKLEIFRETENFIMQETGDYTKSKLLEKVRESLW